MVGGVGSTNPLIGVLFVTSYRMTWYQSHGCCVTSQPGSNSPLVLSVSTVDGSMLPSEHVNKPIQIRVEILPLHGVEAC